MPKRIDEYDDALGSAPEPSTFDVHGQDQVSYPSGGRTWERSSRQQESSRQQGANSWPGAKQSGPFKPQKRGTQQRATDQHIQLKQDPRLRFNTSNAPPGFAS